MEKYKENIEKAIKSLKIADHILYVTYPIIKDKRLLLKSLEEIYNSVINLINAFLQYDYIWKKINLYPDAEENLNTFITKCSKRYNITQEQISNITEILSLGESHKKSPMEFMRKEKLVIMSNNLNITSIDPEKLKKYINTAKLLFEKSRFMCA